MTSFTAAAAATAAADVPLGSVDEDPVPLPRREGGGMTMDPAEVSRVLDGDELHSDADTAEPRLETGRDRMMSSSCCSVASRFIGIVEDTTSGAEVVDRLALAAGENVDTADGFEMVTAAGAGRAGRRCRPLTAFVDIIVNC